MNAPPLRRKSPVHIRDCRLAASFEFLGDRWSLLIVRSALFGLRRFDDFQSELDVPRNVLSARLKRLVSAGIMTRQLYRVAGSRARPEYLLTEMGRGLGLPFLAMRQWANEWVGGDLPPPTTLARASDGSPVFVSLVDAQGQAVVPGELTGRCADWAVDGRRDITD